MMNLHLDTFMRMKDKDLVAMYLNRFLASTAYLGYTKNVNMEQLTQVYRRIYKTPQECDINNLLNLLVTLAISNTYYGDFDEKSKIFVEAALDLIEERFTGVEYVNAKMPTDLD